MYGNWSDGSWWTKKLVRQHEWKVRKNWLTVCKGKPTQINTFHSLKLENSNMVTRVEESFHISSAKYDKCASHCEWAVASSWIGGWWNIQAFWKGRLQKKDFSGSKGQKKGCFIMFCPRYLQSGVCPELSKMPDRLHMQGDRQGHGEKWQLPPTETEEPGYVIVFTERRQKNIENSQWGQNRPEGSLSGGVSSEASYTPTVYELMLTQSGSIRHLCRG